jgi:hypothetical protein
MTALLDQRNAVITKTSNDPNVHDVIEKISLLEMQDMNGDGMSREVLFTTTAGG